MLFTFFKTGLMLFLVLDAMTLAKNHKLCRFVSCHVPIVDEIDEIDRSVFNKVCRASESVFLVKHDR